MLTKGRIEKPRRATTGSAGYDFFSPDTYVLTPGKWTTIDTGVRLTDYDVAQVSEIVRINEYAGKGKRYVGDWFMLIVPRSGLSNKVGFRIRNTVGIIDMDYRDTIKATVTVDEPYTLQKNERFLQGIIIPFGTFSDEIEPTEIRKGGHGSTGRF